MSSTSSYFHFSRKDETGKYLNYTTSSLFRINDPDYKWNETTLPIKTAGSYTSNSCTQTIAFVLRNFVGRISVMATLDNEINDQNTWFPLKLSTSGDYYMEFGNTNLTNDVGTNYQPYGTTGTICEILKGNYTFLQIVIDRDYITATPNDIQKSYVGCLEEILVNL